MAAPIRFLSGRQQQQKIGITGSTEGQKVLEVVGRVGIGSTIFDTEYDLDVRGDVRITGNLTIGDQEGAALSAESLFISGLSTFVGHSTFQNGITVSGVSTFVGFTTFQDNVHIDQNLNVTGVITASSLNITGEGGTGGQAELDNLRVLGFSTFVGVSTFQNGFNVSGVSTFAGDIDVDGLTELDDVNVTGVSTFNNNLHVKDNNSILLGDDNDSYITHDQNNTVIGHTGTGNLEVRVATGKTFTIGKDSASDKIADFNVDGSVALFYNGSEKFSTTSIGASVSNGAASTATLSGPGTLIIDPAPVGDNAGILRIKGDLYVDGTQTIVNSSTLEIADKVIGIATTSISDLLLDGAGIGIGSEGNRKTLLYEYNGSVNPSLKSSENLNVATGKVYQIGETEVLSSNTLSVGTGATVHSPTANVLTLGTSGQESVYIDVNGNVGIGTDNPVGAADANNTKILNVGIVTANVFYGSGGNLEDIIKEKLEGITATLVDSVGTATTLGGDLEIAYVSIDNSNATVGYITAVGFGSTAIYYFNDVTAVGLITDTSINITGIITAASLNITGNSQFDSSVNVGQGLSVSGVLTTTSISGSPEFDGLSVNTGITTLNGVTAGIITGTFLGDGSGLTGLAGVAAGITVTDNDVVEGTVAILNFGPDIDVSPIASGIVTFSLNESQNFAGIVTISNMDAPNASIGIATITELGGINTLGIGTIFEIKTDNTDNGRFFVETTLGEIFVITNDLVDGSLFSVNDSLGVPLIDVENDAVLLTPFGSGKLVGIGTTNPQSKFNVFGDSILDGSLRLTGEFYDVGNSAGGVGKVLTSVGTGVSWSEATATASGRDVISTSSGQVYYITSAELNSGISTSAFVDSNIVMTGIGSIGIGTNAPSQTLDVDGNIRLRGSVYDSINNVGTTNQVLVSNAGAGVTWADLTGIPAGDAATLDGLDSTQFLRSDVDDTKSGLTTFSDNVSVGNSITLYPATGIVSAISFYGDGANLTNTGAALSAPSGTERLVLTGLTTGTMISAATTSILVFDSANNMLGIGTTNPQATLHVVDEFLLSTAGAASTQRITERAYTTDNGSLSWEGSAGQLFSITNNLTSGSIFSVNDVSGIPSIDVDADGTIQLAPFGSAEYVGVGTTNPQAKLDVNGGLIVSGVSTFTNRVIFDSTNSIQIPVGDTSERDAVGVAVTGQIRYNTESASFEGYGPGGDWTSLGGVKDVDGDTYIITETSPGSDEDELYFYTGGSLTATISSTTGAVFNNGVGIGTTLPTSSLHIVGDVLVTGIVTATDFNSTSDAKLKTNVQVIEDPLEKVLQINGVSFNWIKDNKPSMGVIADNIQEVLPELVSDTDPKTVNYNGLIGLLIEVVKEQQTQINSLNERLSKLE